MNPKLAVLWAKTLAKKIPAGGLEGYTEGEIPSGIKSWKEWVPASAVDEAPVIDTAAYASAAASKSSRPSGVRHMSTSARSRAQHVEKTQNSAPLPVPRTVFPAPSNPFDTETNAVIAAQGTKAAPQHSPLKVRVVKALANLMGYNTKGVTAIRETGRLCEGIVNAVEKDRAFWYQSR